MLRLRFRSRRILSVACFTIFVLWLLLRWRHDSALASLLKEELLVTSAEERIPLENLRTRNLLLPPWPLIDQQIPPELEHNLKFSDLPGSGYVPPSHNRNLMPLLQCRVHPNRYTMHIRLAAKIRPVFMFPQDGLIFDERRFINPAVISLPYWSENQYLLVSRVLTDGFTWTQENVVCEANICFTDPKTARPGEKPCTEEDLEVFDGGEGLRCTHRPLTLNVPSTPAKFCKGRFAHLANIAGFLDPRLFWSGKGEPLMAINSNSRYSCLGIWMIDMRSIYPALKSLLGSNPEPKAREPLTSYSSLTELTRNPPESRNHNEKNWMVFSERSSTFLHYDFAPRSFAQLLGGGITSSNLTDPYELSCLREGGAPSGWKNEKASWHQASNSLQLILCERSDTNCSQRLDNTVFWSIIHHKHEGSITSMRYERYFVVWAATPPFQMLAMSKVPVIFADETVAGWSPEESWADDFEQAKLLDSGSEGKGEYAMFTYTTSIAYSWGRLGDSPVDKNIGYLDDEAILGIGIEDSTQGYVRAVVNDLLQCMRTCPGRRSVGSYESH